MKKTCATCGESKNASPSKSSQFSWRKDRNRYHNDCKACVAAKKRKQENTHQERVSNTEKEAIESDPHGHLAADIVAMAIQDCGLGRQTSYWRSLRASGLRSYVTLAGFRQSMSGSI